MARCRTPGDEARLRDAGIEPIVADVSTFDLDALPPGSPTSSTRPPRSAARRAATGGTRSWSTPRPADGSSAACRGVRGFVFCSTGSQYEYQGARPLREDDPPGVHLGVYSLSKIAGRGRSCASRRSSTASPTTIIRIFSTYGPLGGAPADRLDRMLAGKRVRLHPDAPNRYNPIYEDDYVRLGIRALEVGAVPPLTVNWAGSETVSAEDYLAYLGALVGVEPRIEYDPACTMADLAGRDLHARRARPHRGAVARRHAPHARGAPPGSGRAVSDAPTVRAVTGADALMLGATLSRAFLDDPAFSWAAPHPGRRERLGPRYFELTIRHVYLPKGESYTTGDGRAVALWAPPGQWQVPFTKLLPFGPVMVRACGSALPRAMRMLNLMEARHREFAEPHYYLAFVGTDPAAGVEVSGPRSSRTFSTGATPRACPRTSRRRA